MSHPRSDAPERDPDPLAGPLLRWFDRHRRELPWRKSRDPYRIWVAEVLLQQTRVDQAAPYYDRFVEEFPDVRRLASARLDRVLKVWQGAGYYARARHLHAAAREIVRRHDGRLPREIDELEQLPGIGPYIARAIASLAFDVPVLALEANGLRFAARWTRDEGDIRRPSVRRRLAASLDRHLTPRAPGRFNEAIMELGETVCRPRAPRCDRCPVSRGCRAYRETADPSAIPLRRPRPVRPHVRAAVVVLLRHGRWLVQRRDPNLRLGGLWEFPGGQIEPGESPEATARRELLEETGLRAGLLRSRGVVRHAYSHFTVELHVFEGAVDDRAVGPLTSARRWVRPRDLARLPLPKATEKVAALVASASARTGRGGRAGRPRSSRPPASRTWAADPALTEPSRGRADPQVGVPGAPDGPE